VDAVWPEFVQLVEEASAEAVVLEPTVWQATKELGTAIKRSISFKRRRPKQKDAATLAAERVAAAEQAAAAAQKAQAAAEQAEKSATNRAQQAKAALKAAENAAEKKAAEEKAVAAEKAAMANAAELERQKSLPGLPPRASDVRAAVGNLGAAIGRSGRRRSSVTFAADASRGQARGLKPSPEQPGSIVGVVRRATMGAVDEPTYSSVADGGGGGSEPGLPPRASAVARAVDPLDRSESTEVPGLPPRASAVAKATAPLDRTETGESEETAEAALPGPPPRASLVSRAMTRLVSRRSSGVPPLPPTSDGKAAVGRTRREKREARRRAADATGPPSDPTRTHSELGIPPPPQVSDIAAAVRDL